MHFNDKNEKIVYAGSRETEAPFLCTLAGITYPNPQYRIVRHPSPEMVFEYVLSGHGTIETAGGSLPVDGGTFYCISRHADVQYYADPEDPYEKIWINLTGRLPEKLFDFFLLGDVFTARVNLFSQFLEIHDCLERMNPDTAPALYRKILCLLFDMLTEATKETFFPEKDTKHTLDERIRAYIDANIYTDLSLDRIAETFGITKMHVIRIFKARFGITPLQYLLDKKIGIAKSLLTGTVMPIKEIAALLRYANTQHFSSSFKTAVGCTPNKYRQSRHTEEPAP